MQLTVRQALVANFLGGSPDWYKFTVVAFLLINPLVAFSLGMFAAGWLLIAEFIFVLAMALRCYPLQPGGLLAIEAVLIPGDGTTLGMVGHVGGLGNVVFMTSRGRQALR